jgi:hypothetical protein
VHSLDAIKTFLLKALPSSRSVKYVFQAGSKNITIRFLLFYSMSNQYNKPNMQRARVFSERAIMGKNQSLFETGVRCGQ